MLSINCFGQDDPGGQWGTLIMQQARFKGPKLQQFLEYMMWSRGESINIFIDPYTSYILEFNNNDAKKTFILKVYEFSFDKYPSDSLRYYVNVNNRTFIILNPPNWVFQIEPDKEKEFVQARVVSLSGSYYELTLSGGLCENGELFYDVISYIRKR